MIVNRALKILALAAGMSAPAQGDLEKWENMETNGKPTARHEASFTELNGKCYLLGGRRINPVDEFDPATKTWKALAQSPIELHHFQAIEYNGKIWIAGALSGKYPNEKPVPNIYIFDPKKNIWEKGPEIPKDRRRGGNGAVAYEGKIYMVCGIVNGHVGGFIPWLDSYDPATGKWEILPDAPRPRDHFSAVIVMDQIVAAGGRTTSQGTNQVFNLTIPEADIFNLKTGEWSTAREPIPTPRAGTMAIALGHKAIIAGGESTNKSAHSEVEALDTETGTWSSWPSLHTGRHGTGLGLVDGMLYTASGCASRGGGDEIDSTERLAIPFD